MRMTLETAAKPNVEIKYGIFDKAQGLSCNMKSQSAVRKDC